MKWKIALLWLGLLASHARADNTVHEHLIDATRLAWYPGWVFRAMAWYADVPGAVPVETGATLYRLSYRTHDAVGKVVTASGLVAVPHDLPLRGVVSYFHGTSTLRDSAPSAPTLESRLVAGGFAGGRYLLVAPDYIGLGISSDTHPYLHVAATVNAAVDMLRAAREFCGDAGIVWPENLNLIGFSQGGHATATVQRELEAHAEPGLIVRAAAAIDGPYDLAGVAFPFALAGGAPSHSLYLAYLIRGYAALYGHPIESVLHEPYASRVQSLLDGTHDNDTIVAQVPPGLEARTTGDPMLLRHGRSGRRHIRRAANEATRFTRSSESINLPVLSVPIVRNGQALIDGGLVNNIPADVLVSKGCNFVIAVSVTAKMERRFNNISPESPMPAWQRPGTLQTILRSLLVQNHSLNALGVQPADVVIEPDVTGFDLTEFMRSKKLAAIGEAAATEQVPPIQQLLKRLDPCL